MSEQMKASAGTSDGTSEDGAPTASVPSIRALTAEIADRFNETNLALIRKVVAELGPEGTLALVAEAVAIEAAGGMLTNDQSRRRTPGGVFFHLARGRMTPEARWRLFPRVPSRKPTKLATTDAIVAFDLAEALSALEETGEATTVKITLVGRPGRPIERGDVFIAQMDSGKVPTIPRGLPMPSHPTSYALLIARRQWAKIAPALASDPTDKMIAEGWPELDPKSGKVLVYVTKVSTAGLDRAEREKQKAATAN